MLHDPTTHPTGFFQCLTCLSCWRGAELRLLHLLTSSTWVCGDPACQGDVIPLDGAPRAAPFAGDIPILPSGPGVWRRRPLP